MKNVYFITGACGTGKSSIIPYLKDKLRHFDIHDFDELGVPENPTIEWRKKITDHWISIAQKNALKNTSTIISGLSIPQEINLSKLRNLSVLFCLLDISKSEREIRLRKRNASNELIDDIEELEGFKKWIPDSGFKYIVIDTTELTIEQVRDKIIRWIIENEKS